MEESLFFQIKIGYDFEKKGILNYKKEHFSEVFGERFTSWSQVKDHFSTSLTAIKHILHLNHGNGIVQFEFKLYGKLQGEEIKISFNTLSDILGYFKDRNLLSIDEIQNIITENNLSAIEDVNNTYPQIENNQTKCSIL